MYIPRKFKYLDDNEIAGAETINPFVDFVRHIRTTDDFVDFSPNEGGGINLDVDRGAMLEWIKAAYPHPSLDFTFKVKLDGSRFTCSGGKVLFPDNSVSISGLSQRNCSDGSVVYIELASRTAGSLQYGSMPTKTVHESSGSFKVQLPVAETYKNGNTWQVRYYHIGDYSFLWYPHAWIPYYNRSDIQFLGHAQDGDGVVWVTSTECQQNQQQ